jgi:hypothetical protein
MRSRRPAIRSQTPPLCHPFRGSVHDCRGLQHELYASRRVVGVPDWFYRLTRERRQRNMQDVAREQAQRVPAALR